MTSARIAIMALFGVAALTALTFRWDRPKEDVQSGKIVEAGEPTGLVVRGGLTSNTVETGDDLDLWIVLHNRGQNEINGIRFVDIQIPGFREAGNCWRYHAPSCRPDGTVSGLPSKLAAGESAIVLGELTPSTGSGRYGLLFTYAWINPLGGELRNALTLGPIEVTTWWRLSIVTLSGRLKSLITDLALPVILVFSGWWLQRLQKEREDRQKEAEDARKKAEDARLQRQTQTVAVLNTLLESNLKDTQKYYLPFAARLYGLIRQARNALSGQRADERRCFHAMMVFLRQHQFMVDGIGGFHFQSRTGEAVVVWAWRSFLLHLERHFRPEIRSGAVMALDIGESLFDFNRRIERERATGTEVAGPLSQAEEAVLAWIRHDTEPLSSLIPILEIMHDTVMFELNRPFEYWYGTRERFPKSGLSAAKAKLPREPQNEIGNLEESLEAYFKEGERWETATTS